MMNLPKDILFEILDYLTIEDLLYFTSVNKELHQLEKRTDVLAWYKKAGENYRGRIDSMDGLIYNYEKFDEESGMQPNIKFIVRGINSIQIVPTHAIMDTSYGVLCKIPIKYRPVIDSHFDIILNDRHIPYRCLATLSVMTDGRLITSPPVNHLYEIEYNKEIEYDMVDEIDGPVEIYDWQNIIYQCKPLGAEVVRKISNEIENESKASYYHSHPNGMYHFTRRYWISK